MIMPINKDNRELEAINDTLLEAINDALRSKHKDIKRLREQSLISEKFGDYLTQLTLMRGSFERAKFFAGKGGEVCRAALVELEAAYKSVSLMYFDMRMLTQEDFQRPYHCLVNLARKEYEEGIKGVESISNRRVIK